jgi:DNA-binding transcriptional MerR regulator
MLKIGELAQRSGLTVRTLHHYDDIGLLTPSARSDAGYRLYHRNDISRLQQIQALRRFGMALADIGHFLANPGASRTDVIARQLAALDHQIAEAGRLRDQLTRLQAQLLQGEEPALSTWLTTLEHMTVYDKYFSQEELSKMPLYHSTPAQTEWAALVAQVQQQMDAGVAPTAPAAQQLAVRWMQMLARDSGPDPAIAHRLDHMWAQEAGVREHSGITPAVRQYIMAANAEVKLALYAKYMLPEELASMRQHFQCRGREWPALIMAIRAQMAADPSPSHPQARELARQWLDLFSDMVGPQADARLRFRAALENEPALQIGRMMSDELLAFLRQASSPT